MIEILLGMFLILGCLWFAIDIGAAIRSWRRPPAPPVQEHDHHHHGNVTARTPGRFG